MRKITLWEEIIESKHQDYYDEVIFKKTLEVNWKEKRKESILKFLSKFDDIANDTSKEFAVAKSTILDQLPKFFRKFPDADFRDEAIYLVPSLFKFNGQGVTYKENAIISFGVDFIVLLKKFPNLIPGLKPIHNPNIFYIHEIFHLYHNKQFKRDIEQEKSILFSAWEEGLASYVSEVMTPTASISEILMDNNLSDCMAKKEFYLRLFQKDMHKSDEDTYRKWFLISSVNTEVPKRAGYCAGYLFAKDLASKKSILELSKLTWSEVYQEAKEFFIQFN